MTAEPLPEPLPTLPVYDAIPSPTSEEKNWAMIAHLSVLVNLFTGILGPVIAGVIYLAWKDRSRYIAYQSLQSLILQLIVWVGGGTIVAIAWIVTGLLSLVLVGLCMIPFAIALSIIPVIAPIYSIVAAVKTSQGSDFKYWLIGDWTRGTLTGQ
jgi:uncharacterized Tic20 family protein